jgi:hypothetical protein
MRRTASEPADDLRADDSFADADLLESPGGRTGAAGVEAEFRDFVIGRDQDLAVPGPMLSATVMNHSPGSRGNQKRHLRDLNTCGAHLAPRGSGIDVRCP